MAKISLSIPSSFNGEIMDALEDAISESLPKISSYAIDRILQIADQKLTTSAHAYRQGFTQDGSVIATATGFDITPVGPIAEALEEGFDAFDIKAVMLQHAKPGNDYVDVAFRHGKDKTTRLQSMPADVKRLVNNAIRRENRAAKKEGRDKRSRLRVTGSMAPRKTFTRALRVGGEKVNTRVSHKTSIHSEMVRTMDKGTGSTTFNTIRRISKNSDPQSWWHPGFAGVHAIDKVAANLERVALDVAKVELRAVGFIVR